MHPKEKTQPESCASPALRVRRQLQVCGIVQGVGFRPFVYRLAIRFGLAGWVLNNPAGVTIQVEGSPESIDAFEQALRGEKPPLASIESIESVDLAPLGEQSFAIRESASGEPSSTFVPPDVATCADCLRELFDPADRRYRYPFINCTNCGPRYTIIHDLPYDRPLTTMAPFTMCPLCRAEYEDPANRRFHAQPNACWQCGPRLQLFDERGRPLDSADPIAATAELLRRGLIVAIKGLGGYHLAVDATNEAAVRRLRQRKRREEKPFAIMCPDLEAAQRISLVSRSEQLILESPERPIVLVPKRPHHPIASSVAPRSAFFGVMLPYTPVHHLLLRDQFSALVMTSGNLTDEPIVSSETEAFERLGGIADAFLTHNRDIHVRCDDSIVRVILGREVVQRRARGFAPRPLRIPAAPVVVLAVGAELKNAVCVARSQFAFFSQHVGDLKDARTFDVFHRTVHHLCELLEVKPKVIAHDLHPSYLSTQYAREHSKEMELVGVQHHHAHIAACMAEHCLTGPVIGVAFDGTGYGLDGTVWGGEFLISDLADFRRAAHLRPVPMPGGEQAIREPDRMALAYLVETFGPHLSGAPVPFLDLMGQRRVDALLAIMLRRINCPATSSMGRLFDAVSALTGTCTRATFEGQPAMELEGIATSTAERYEFSLEGPVVDWRHIIRGVCSDVSRGLSARLVSAKFHKTIAAVIAEVCRRLRQQSGLNDVVLSGGVFQNARLVRRSAALLRADAFRVFLPQRVPANDGGIALGQAVVALHRRRQTP